MQEFTEYNLGIIACWRAASLMPSIIEFSRAKQSFFGCWTAAERHDGSGSLSRKRANEVTGANAGGRQRLAIRTLRAARIAQFCRCRMSAP